VSQSGTSIFISATDTNIGKTYISIALLRELLARGYKPNELAYYKPLQCGIEETDIESVAKAVSGVAIYNSYTLKYPAAPSFAARQEGIEIDIQRIIDDYQKIKAKIIIIEGAGGLAVPIKGEYLVSDLVKDLGAPLLLVTRPNLGTINHSLLSLEHAQAKKLSLLGFYTNYQEGTKYLPHELSAPSIISEISGLRSLRSIPEIIQQCLIAPNISN
jgi:dethiobiotin synthetase